MRRSLLLATIAAFLPLPSAFAAVGMTWSTAGAEQFAQGKLQGVSVLSTGEVELAPAREDIAGLQAEFVWDLSAAEDGTVFAATAGPAAVYVIRDGRAEVLCKSEQQMVLSVLALPDGSVLAGTGPKGIIYRVNRAGKVTLFADLDAAYVWDMATGPHSEVYCATGPKGKLFKLNGAGEGSAILEVKQKNLMCVAAGQDGAAYVGTDTGGYIYRVSPTGRATVIYDAEEDEVHSLLLDAEGRLYACTAQGESPGRHSEPSDEGKGPEGAASDAPPVVAPPTAGAPGAANSLYRIVPERGAEMLMRLDQTFLLSLAAMGDQVLAGTGTGGRVVGVGPGALTRVVTQVDAAHVTAMVATPRGEVVVGTANPGSLLRLLPGSRKAGTLLSKPFDASYLSRWGRVWWKQADGSGCGIRVRLRTGNSEEPDDHWSDWSTWATEPAGTALELPAGRFGQFAAELSPTPGSTGPRLLQVGVSYLQDNRRPRIEDVSVNGQSVLGKVEHDGEGRRSRRPSESPGRNRSNREQEAPPAQLQIAWQAADPNEDELIYELQYRALDETEWKVLKKDLADSEPHVWDTSRVPDGYYLVKLVASDRLSRPGAEALTDERVSVPVLIDNRGPGILDLKAVRKPDGTFEITGTAQDDFGRITKIEVSRNSGDWAPVFPDDGLLDSRQETFRYATDRLTPGEHVFVFAAADEHTNTGSGKVVVQVVGEAP
jgi:hypothetical protein